MCYQMHTFRWKQFSDGKVSVTVTHCNQLPLKKKSLVTFVISVFLLFKALKLKEKSNGGINVHNVKHHQEGFECRGFMEI